jgi:hypothetical protein
MFLYGNGTEIRQKYFVFTDPHSVKGVKTKYMVSVISLKILFVEDARSME